MEPYVKCSNPIVYDTVLIRNKPWHEIVEEEEMDGHQSPQGSLPTRACHELQIVNSWLAVGDASESSFSNSWEAATRVPNKGGYDFFSSMKTIFWNIRGIANRPTQQALCSMIKKHSPDFLCLAEPMTTISSIKHSFWRSIGLNLIGVNDRGQRLPNIWVFCSPNISSAAIISSSNQHIFVQFDIGGASYGVAFVYAATTIVDRRSLWLSLAQICSNFSDPIFIVGDFNAILGAHEKSGGNLPRSTSCDEFQAMVDTCNLVQIDQKGSPFTWTNGRKNYANIEMM